MWDNTVVIFFGVLSRNLPTVIEGNQKGLQSVILSQGQVINP